MTDLLLWLYMMNSILPFFIRLLFEKRGLKRKYPEAYQSTLKVGESAAKEFPMLISMFNIIAKKEGRENSYDFVKFNIAWFNAMDEEGTWKIKEIRMKT